MKKLASNYYLNYDFDYNYVLVNTLVKSKKFLTSNYTAVCEFIQTEFLDKCFDIIEGCGFKRCGQTTKNLIASLKLMHTAYGGLSLVASFDQSFDIVDSHGREIPLNTGAPIELKLIENEETKDLLKEIGDFDIDVFSVSIDEENPNYLDDWIASDVTEEILDFIDLCEERREFVVYPLEATKENNKVIKKKSNEEEDVDNYDEASLDELEEIISDKEEEKEEIKDSKPKVIEDKDYIEATVCSLNDSLHKDFWAKISVRYIKQINLLEFYSTSGFDSHEFNGGCIKIDIGSLGVQFVEKLLELMRRNIFNYEDNVVIHSRDETLLDGFNFEFGPKDVCITLDSEADFHETNLCIGEYFKADKKAEAKVYKETYRDFYAALDRIRTSILRGR